MCVVGWRAEVGVTEVCMNSQTLRCAQRLIIRHERTTWGRKYLQNSDVLEASEVGLGDACEVIPIQLPAKTDTQTPLNNSSLFSH